MRYTCSLYCKFIAAVLLLPAITQASDPKNDDAKWGTVVEDSESYRLGSQRLQAFSETEPYLGSTPSTSADFNNNCIQLNRRCLRYLRSNPSVAKAALPNNSEYWRSYLALLEVTPLARVANDFDEEFGVGDRNNIVEATRFWAMREILINGTLDIQDLYFQVQAHRRLLAESNFLIDKMIYTATAGITLPAINVFMAQRANQPLDVEETKLLDDMLRPFSKEERSMRRPFRGEYQLLLERAGEYDFTEEAINDVLRTYAYVSDRSELPWRDYWSSGLDVWADVPLYLYQDNFPAWANYTSNLRYVGAQLILLSALREIYEGRASPGIPSQPPPARWHWQWRVGEEELCLEPGDIHPSLVQYQPVLCVQYLDQ